MGLLQSIFGGHNRQEAVMDLLAKGAVIIDVRTPGEFQGGHVKGSRNIPLQVIRSRVQEIKKLNRPVILCCASGNRSGQAASYLASEGIECENGGSWTNVNGIIQK